MTDELCELTKAPIFNQLNEFVTIAQETYGSS